LKGLGFVFHRQGKGSHEIWIHMKTRRSVTVDAHYPQIDVSLMKVMVRESGVTRETFYGATKTTAKKIR
jgi:predicted RNA binding protein YcfA (HicA-like mRNA interferase family)